MHKNAHGFSLLEALVTVLVLSIGLLGLGQLQARLWAGAGDLHMLGDAYLLGENLLEINSLDWLPADTRQALVQQGKPGVSVTIDLPGPGRSDGTVVTSTVSLRWRRPSGEQSLHLSASVNTGIAAGDSRWLLPWQ